MRRPRSILPANVQAVLAQENAFNRVVFGLLAVGAAVMGATCFWHLQALVTAWASFVQGWSRILQG